MNDLKDQEYVDPEAKQQEEPNGGEADEDAGTETDEEEEEPDEGDDEVALADVLPILQQMCTYMGQLVAAVQNLRPADPGPAPKSKPQKKKRTTTKVAKKTTKYTSNKPARTWGAN